MANISQHVCYNITIKSYCWTSWAGHSAASAAWTPIQAQAHAQGRAQEGAPELGLLGQCPTPPTPQKPQNWIPTWLSLMWPRLEQHQFLE